MKTFILKNTAETLKVEYITDAIGTLPGNFTIMEIRDLSDAEASEGLDFQLMPNSYHGMVKFATDNNLLLDMINADGTVTNVVNSVTALAITTTTLDDVVKALKETTILTFGAITAPVYEKNVVTFAAFAATGQGDYFHIVNSSGTKFAIWFDKDANGTAPTGALYEAADHQIEVDIVTGDSAIVIAGKFKTAVELNADWDGFETIVDNGDGTLDIVSSVYGNLTNATPHNTGDTGAGSISTVITAGVSNKQGDSVSFPLQDASVHTLWLDVDADGTVPNNIYYTGADDTVMLSVATADTAADVATAAYDALLLESWFTDNYDITDNLDGTLTCVYKFYGAVGNISHHDSEGNEGGSISENITIVGQGVHQDIEIEYEGGNGEVTMTVSVGTLPTALEILSNRLVGWVTANAATVTFTIKIEDEFGASDTQALSLTITNV